MNKVLNALLAIAGVVVVALPAAAGPDFIAIEQARKTRQAAVADPAAPPTRRECPTRQVLPLDHGPRAVTTPYLNERRKARFEARKKACEEMRRADPATARRSAG